MRRGHHRGARRAAFTLIELLVVIAIISLLVSILVPSLSRAKDLARNLQCLTQLHTLGTGLALYTHDSNDILPKYTSSLHILYYGQDWICTAHGWTQYRTWVAHGLLKGLDIVPQKEMFYCPSNTCNNIQWYLTSVDTWTKGWASKPSSYDYIGGIYLNDRSTMLDHPGRMLITEYSVFGGFEYHNGKINVLYLGGHAEPIDNAPLVGQAWNWYLLDQVRQGA